MQLILVTDIDPRQIPSLDLTFFGNHFWLNHNFELKETDDSDRDLALVEQAIAFVYYFLALIKERIREAVNQLTENPRPSSVVKLTTIIYAIAPGISDSFISYRIP